ncbi:hypothetical protein MASR1M101_41380 [Gemmatimonas sp.]
MPCKSNCKDCCECLSPIPNGGTCESACRHIAKCKAIFGQKGDETCCQWIPSRFSPRAIEPQREVSGD